MRSLVNSLLVVAVFLPCIAYGGEKYTEYELDQLPVVLGAKNYTGPRDISATAKIQTAGDNNLYITVAVKDDDPIISDDYINSDHVEIWLAVPSDQLIDYPASYIYWKHLKAYYKTNPDHADLINLKRAFAGRDTQECKGDDGVRRDTGDFNVFRKARINFGFVHYGIMPGATNVHVYDQKYSPNVDLSDPGSMAKVVSMKTTSDGYKFTLQLPPAALGYVTKYGVSKLRFMIDVVDRDSGKGVTVLSTSENRVWGDPNTFSELTLKDPISVPINSQIPSLGNPHLAPSSPRNSLVGRAPKYYIWQGDKGWLPVSVSDFASQYIADNWCDIRAAESISKYEVRLSTGDTGYQSFSSGKNTYEVFNGLVFVNGECRIEMPGNIRSIFPLADGRIGMLYDLSSNASGVQYEQMPSGACGGADNQYLDLGVMHERKLKTYELVRTNTCTAEIRLLRTSMIPPDGQYMEIERWKLVGGDKIEYVRGPYTYIVSWGKDGGHLKYHIAKSKGLDISGIMEKWYTLKNPRSDEIKVIDSLEKRKNKDIYLGENHSSDLNSLLCRSLEVRAHRDETYLVKHRVWHKRCNDLSPDSLARAIDAKKYSVMEYLSGIGAYLDAAGKQTTKEGLNAWADTYVYQAEFYKKHRDDFLKVAALLYARSGGYVSHRDPAKQNPLVSKFVKDRNTYVLRLKDFLVAHAADKETKENVNLETAFFAAGNDLCNLLDSLLTKNRLSVLRLQELYLRGYKYADVVRVLEEHGFDASVKNEKSQSLFDLAVSQRNIDWKLLDKLVAAGVNVDDVGADGLTPLIRSIKAWSGYGNDVQQLAALEHYLLNHGADPKEQASNGESAFFVALGRELSNFYGTDKRGEVIAPFLDKGVSAKGFNVEGDTALTYAVRTDAGWILERLLKAGANINEKDKDGHTSLVIALREGNIGLVSTLLKLGADPRVKDRDGNDSCQYIGDSIKQDALKTKFIAKLLACRPSAGVQSATWAQQSAKKEYNVIVYSSITSGVSRLYAINPDGSTPRRLTNFPDAASNPHVSPNGKFVIYDAVDDKGVSNAFVSELASGKKISELRWGHALGWDTQKSRYAYYMNRLSHKLCRLFVDGSSYCDGYVSMWGQVDVSSLTGEYLVNFGPKIDEYGSNYGKHERTYRKDEKGDDRDARWSLDGKNIVFSSYQDGKSQIYVMNADGSNVRQLTNDKFENDMPVWSPDGKRIAYVSNKTGHKEIYVMNVDGKQKHQLTNTSADSTSPDWVRNNKDAIPSSGK